MLGPSHILFTTHLLHTTFSSSSLHVHFSLCSCFSLFFPCYIFIHCTNFSRCVGIFYTFGVSWSCLNQKHKVQLLHQHLWLVHFSFFSWSLIFHHGCFFGIARVVISNSWVRVASTSRISLWVNLKISFLYLTFLFHVSLLQIMDEAQEQVVFTMGFMMLFQLINHIYNSPIQDLHSIMNPSTTLEIVKKNFYVITLHRSNLTTAHGNLSLELGYQGWDTKCNLIFHILVHRIWRLPMDGKL